MNLYHRVPKTVSIHTEGSKTGRILTVTAFDRESHNYMNFWDFFSRFSVILLDIKKIMTF